MTKFDVVDEAVIAATPQEITAALNDEGAGRSRWWLPYLRMESIGATPSSEVGSVWDITVNSKGKVDHKAGSASFRSRVVESEPDRRLVSEYFAGAFRGRMEITLEPVDAGRTRIRSRWQTDPHGLMRLMALFVDVKGSHSTVMQQGFLGIERYAAQHRQPA